MEILIEKTIKQYRKILWIGLSSDELMVFLANSDPKKHTQLRIKLENGYDVIKNIEIDETIGSPVWDSKDKKIVDMSITPDYIAQKEEEEKEQLIQTRIVTNQRSVAIADLKTDNILDQDEKIIRR